MSVPTSTFAPVETSNTSSVPLWVGVAFGATARVSCPQIQARPATNVVHPCETVPLTLTRRLSALVPTAATIQTWPGETPVTRPFWLTVATSVERVTQTAGGEQTCEPPPYTQEAVS